ncbi:MAG: type II toxin-antitoxin system MqsA family antitoxin [Defluviitaleaceae bacterium]|nr:type II toxin-antitoxin system MqsA family antitoxin [Defluviitaleaceae bacterium]
MRCLHCKGNMANDTTSDFTDLKTCIVVIRNVPCHKCTQCGEIVYDFSVGERLEQIVDDLKDSLAEIAVVQYSDKAA